MGNLKVYKALVNEKLNITLSNLFGANKNLVQPGKALEYFIDKKERLQGRKIVENSWSWI